MDTPQVTPALLTVDFADCDAYFEVEADDGGFWALGLAEPCPELLRGVPMSTSTTGAAQRSRLAGAGLRVRDLPRLRDVDTAADATAVAAAAPAGVFAAELGRLRTATAPVPARIPGRTAGRTRDRTADRTAGLATGWNEGFVAGLKAVRAAGTGTGGRDTGPVSGRRGAGR